jgi:hypothetical protein
VCGASVTTQLPASQLNKWENTTTCGSTTPSAAEVAKWNADSILVDGVFAYPKTEVQFYDCTLNATAVTAMAQLEYNEVFTANGQSSTLTGYHCYTGVDGCDIENLGNGINDAASAMISGCVPRHQ